jgi:hypothetical protein
VSGVPRGLARHVGYDPPERMAVAVDRDGETRFGVAGGTDRVVAVLDCRPVVPQHVGRRGWRRRPCRVPGRRPRRSRRGGSRTNTAPPRLGAGRDQGRKCRCRPEPGAAAHQTARRPSSARSAGRTTRTPGPCRARLSRRVARAHAESPPCRHGNSAARSTDGLPPPGRAGCRALLTGSMILAQAETGLALAGCQALARATAPRTFSSASSRAGPTCLYPATPDARSARSAPPTHPMPSSPSAHTGHQATLRPRLSAQIH